MKPRQSGHPYIETIQRYYQGCNTADFDLMLSTFTTDVVHYFVDHGAVVTIDLVVPIGIQVGKQPLILLDIQVLE